jgi:hypothetical protein
MEEVLIKGWQRDWKESVKMAMRKCGAVIASMIL